MAPYLWQVGQAATLLQTGRKRLGSSTTDSYDKLAPHSRQEGQSGTFSFHDGIAFQARMNGERLLLTLQTGMKGWDPPLQTGRSG
jgi:hypothetical protein